MAEAEAQKNLQNSQDMIKSDITLLTIQCRDAAGGLFTHMARNNGDALVSYNIFIDLFYQLFMVFRHNASETGKIKDWAKKEQVYDDFFNGPVAAGKYEPKKALGNWNMMLKDLVKVGVYNLTATEFVEREP